MRRWEVKKDRGISKLGGLFRTASRILLSDAMLQPLVLQGALEGNTLGKYQREENKEQVVDSLLVVTVPEINIKVAAIKVRDTYE